MSAVEITRALGGRWRGSYGIARCPGHDDREPSLSIREAEDGKILIRCHAGCDQKRVISGLRSLGLWEDCGSKPFACSASHAGETRQPARNYAKGTEVALAIWNAAVSADGSLAETYLAARGLHLTLPLTLRFHAGLKHPSGGTWPAMIALVASGLDDVPLAIHRTFLAHDGSGKAPVAQQKMMLGPCRGCAVKLAKPRNVLMVGEGIETCLAAMQARDLPAWAALSTSGLLALGLPPELRDVIVLADGDEAGKTAARGAALHWKREGRRVRIAHASDGMDFNDMLLGQVSSKEGRLQ
jgi:putative DNA primase/helicase